MNVHIINVGSAHQYFDPFQKKKQQHKTRLLGVRFKHFGLLYQIWDFRKVFKTGKFQKQLGRLTAKLYSSYSRIQFTYYFCTHNLSTPASAPQS